MSLSVGIVGLPNVGKSTLFNALLKRQAALAANYPFATIEPNVGVVDVPDPRLSRLVEVVRTDYGLKQGTKEIPEKVIPATISFYDIAGLVKGASKGEGLGNAFLGHIREVDAIIHLVRDFKDENVIRAGAVTPEEDISVVNTELILADLQTIDKLIFQAEKDLRGDKSDKNILKHESLKKIKLALDSGVRAFETSLTKEEREAILDVNLLTLKPVMYVYNVDEEDVGKYSDQKTTYDNSDKLFISAKIESEIASLATSDERDAFLQSLGIIQSGLDKIINEGYKLLNLETFFTIGPKEVHAWTITKGSTAPQAAGKIHTDFQRGFISAEIISYRALDAVGSEKKARGEGLVRLEGKNYVMHDGDCVEFHFNV